MSTIRPLLLVYEAGVPVALREATDGDLADLWTTLQAARPDVVQPPAVLPILAGTVTWDRATALSGAGTSFTSALAAGSVVALGGVWLTVVSVESDTAATVALTSDPATLPAGADPVVGTALLITT